VSLYKFCTTDPANGANGAQHTHVDSITYVLSMNQIVQLPPPPPFIPCRCATHRQTFISNRNPLAPDATGYAAWTGSPLISLLLSLTRHTAKHSFRTQHRPAPDTTGYATWTGSPLISLLLSLTRHTALVHISTTHSRAPVAAQLGACSASTNVFVADATHRRSSFSHLALRYRQPAFVN
jgi:hypothetical protein